HLERALARERLGLGVGVEHVVRRRSWAAAGQAVRQETAAIDAELQRAGRLESLLVDHPARASRPLAGAASRRAMRRARPILTPASPRGRKMTKIMMTRPTAIRL